MFDIIKEYVDPGVLIEGYPLCVCKENPEREVFNQGTIVANIIEDAHGEEEAFTIEEGKVIAGDYLALVEPNRLELTMRTARDVLTDRGYYVGAE